MEHEGVFLGVCKHWQWHCLSDQRTHSHANMHAQAHCPDSIRWTDNKVASSHTILLLQYVLYVYYRHTHTIECLNWHFAAQNLNWEWFQTIQTKKKKCSIQFFSFCYDVKVIFSMCLALSRTALEIYSLLLNVCVIVLWMLVADLKARQMRSARWPIEVQIWI